MMRNDQSKKLMAESKTRRSYKKLAFVSSAVETAKQAQKQLEKRYGSVPLDKADAVIALGGDGLMLQTLHDTMKLGTSIYGMHQGSIGFLMNDYQEKGLLDRLNSAQINIIHPLQMCVTDCDGKKTRALAINEVSLLRQRYQAANYGSRLMTRSGLRC